MTRQEFLEEVQAAGIDPKAFDFNGPRHDTFILDDSNYDYRVYYSERGEQFETRHFITESEALEHLLEMLKRDPTTRLRSSGGGHAR